MLSRVPGLCLVVALVVALAACDGSAVSEGEAASTGASLSGAEDASAVIEALPTQMREHVVLLDDAAHGASLEHPRIIAFSADARLLVSVGTDPMAADYDTAYLAELADDGRWRFEARGPEAGMRDCSGCHGVPSRPIFDRHDAFGDGRGTLTAEQAGALARAWDDPTHRLGRFELDLDAEVRRLWLPGRYHGSPVATFERELGARVAEALAARMERRDDSGRDRYRVLLEELCWPMNDTVSEAFDGGVGVAERLGVDERDLRLQRRAQDARGAPLWRADGVPLETLVAFVVLDDLSAADPVLASFFEPVETLRRRMLRDWWGLRGADRWALLRAGHEVALDPTSVFDEALGGAHDDRRAAFCTALAERAQAP